MDIADDIRQFVLANLPLPKKKSERAKVEAMNPHDLLILYFNWRDRYVEPRPRIVHQSGALAANPLATNPNYKPALEQIIDKIKTGKDLTPHLSRGIDNPYTSTGPSYKSHLDLLLNDWGVHHLHLSTVEEPDGFMKRTGPLLFAVFRPNDAYLVDIMKHGKWADDSVIRTIVQEWPDAGIVNRLPGFTGIETPLSEGQRMSLREAHALGVFEIDGAVYAPMRMLTTAGVSIDHVNAADNVMRQVRVHTSPTDGVHIPVRLMTDGNAFCGPESSVPTRRGGCPGAEMALCIRQNCDRYVYPLL